MRRFELINLISASIRAKDYLEIGVSKGQNLSSVKVANKTGVDPAPRLAETEPQYRQGLVGVRMYAWESDKFFAENNETFDVIFVDGLHLYDQAVKDVLNALNVLNTGGFVVVHDLLPNKEEEAARERDTYIWNGDVWKVMYDLHVNHPEVETFVVDDDCGMGVVWPREEGVRFEADFDRKLVNLPFSLYETRKHEFMDIIAADEALIASRLIARKAALMAAQG